MSTETEHTRQSERPTDRLSAYRAQLAAMSDRALSAEYAWILRGTSDRVFGRNARAVHPRIVAELAKRGMSR